MIDIIKIMTNTLLRFFNSDHTKAYTLTKADTGASSLAEEI